MKRSRHPVQPLLAAKLRPRRRPPIAVAGGPPTPRLRLDRGSTPAEPIDADSKERDCRAILANVHRIFGALTAARSSVATGLLRLRELEASVRTAERLEPATLESDPKQQHVDQLLAAIGSLATNTLHEGRPLLDGAWSVNLCEAGSPTHRTLNLPSLQPMVLGADSSGIGIASLSTGESLALARRDFSGSLGVIQRASRALSRAQADIESFLLEVVEPLQSALFIAMENAASSITARADAGFAAEVGRLTRSDALSAATDAERRRRAGVRAGLRLTRGPRPRRRLE